jgi:hypothetical protein
MKLPQIGQSLVAGALCVLFSPGIRAQIVELRATLNAAQEVAPNVSTSTATGSAIMLYDVGANTFDLMISISGMSNPATASHIHEAAAGANGGVVTNLGAEAVYTRSGTTLTATFRNVTHGGDKLKLLQSGAYYNIHSAQFPGGEIRGQLIARPVRLVANLDVAQEQAAFPAVNLSSVTNFGGAVMLYNPATNQISIRHSLFNYTSTFTNSHIHTGARGVSGGVNTQLGNNANAGAYSSANGFIDGAHDITFGGDPLLLLTGGTYLNYHSQAFPNGQLRGQITVSSESLGSRFGNLSIRGFVGAGDQVLIGGISVQGNEPVRTLITAKGPSLTAFGVVGALTNPRLALFDSAGRQIALNDDIGTVAATSDLAKIPGVPTNTAESALVVVLPPGNYTAIVSATTGTGVALLETYDLRGLGAAATTASLPNERGAATSGGLAASTKATAIELCAAPIAPAALAAK